MDHVLILAPYRRDADYLSRLMLEHAIPVATSSGIEDIAARLEEGPEMLVATHEALSPRVTDLVAEHLNAQPPWAEMPVVVLLDRASPTSKVQSELIRVWPRARHLFYQRPVIPVELVMFHADGENVSIDEIVHLTFQPYQLLGEDRFTAAGPSLVLSREAGTTLALCLHELTTNALKYGALSIPSGRVSLHWSLSAESSELSLCWCESGGPKVSEPARVGYGTRYLRSALRGMFGQNPVIAFRPEGPTCTVSGSFARVSSKVASRVGKYD